MTDNIYIDLHTHSRFSDGTDTPYELLMGAKNAGLSAIALTDHDTVDGLSEFLFAGSKIGIEAVPGIELAAWHKKKEIHIVGLFIDPKSPILLDCLEKIKKSRIERNEKMIERLNKIGLQMSYEEVLKEAGGDIITRAHFATLMAKKKYISSVNEAFVKYLSPGKLGYLERDTLSPKDCINAIKESGGTAVLAHPTLYQLDFSGLSSLLTDLVSFGLDGIEAMYSTYTKNQQKEIIALANNFKLKKSGGSDYHGKNKPDIQIGIGKGLLKVPNTFLEECRPYQPYQLF